LRLTVAVPDDLAVFKNPMSARTPPCSEIARRPARPPNGLLWVALAALVALVAVVGAGCGSQTESGSPTPVASPTVAPRPTAEPPAAVNGWYLGTQSEEQVRVWADLTGDEIEALKAALARRYPQLDVEWRRGNDIDLYQETLVDARASAPNWDVYVGDRGTLLRQPRIALRWTPPEARTLPATLVDSEGAWHAVALTFHVIQYHAELVPPSSVPPTYDALLHPGYFGRLAIEDFDLVWLKGLIETRGLDGASALIRGLAQQAVVFRNDARSLVVFVTAGAQAVAIDARMDIVERERRAGGKTAWVAPRPAIAQPLAMVVSASTDRPNGARLVGNFLLSQDAQAILAAAGRAPSRPEIDPDPQTLLRGVQASVTLPPDAEAERALREQWQRLWGRR
jgi:ABC-type Fe3+ transport system substrate-binding protein